MALNLGSIAADDFLVILSDLKRPVSLAVVTQANSNISGDESLTYATAVYVDMVFLKKSKKYILDKEGLLDDGDCYVMAPPSVGIKRYDKVSVVGDKGLTETYMLDQVIRRQIGTSNVYDYGIGFKT
jgi:hypothetical protein